MPPSEQGPETYHCDECADVVSVRKLSKTATDTFLCDACSVTVPCDACGTPTTVSHRRASTTNVTCQDCNARTEPSKSSFFGLSKRAVVAVLTLLTLALLRSADVVLKLVVRLSEDLLFLRPLVPAGAASQFASSDVVLPVLGVGVLVFTLNALLPLPVIPLLSFPGTVVHETAHLLACRYHGVPVYEVDFFSLDTRMGFVRHEIPESFSTSFAISAAPLLVNTMIGLAVAIVFTLLPPDSTPVVQVGLLWLAFSIAARALPSTTDANNVWTRLLDDWRDQPTVLLAVPFVILLHAGNVLRLAYVELLYAISVLVVGITIGHGLL